MSAAVITPEAKPEPIDVENWTDFLTHDQRIAAIAEILATGALRVLKERHEQNSK